MNIDEILKAVKEDERLTKEEIIEIWQYNRDNFKEKRWQIHEAIETAYLIGLKKGQAGK